MQIVDTHTHLYTEEFDSDRADVVQRAWEAGVTHLFLPNIDGSSVNRMLSMCADYPGICHPLIGLHPEEVRDDYLSVLEEMKRLLDSPQEGKKFVGIGEVGLDFYWDSTFRLQQLDAFEQQVRWASEKGLPLVIHSRAAFPALCRLLLQPS